MNNKNQVKAITITYLANISFSSLNGGDSDVDNINVIKKITTFNGDEYPYISSQAIRRALRDQLYTLGYTLSPILNPQQGTSNSGAEDDNETTEDSKTKHPPTTKCDPVQYIDDDLFGYMNAQTETKKRTSPVRVSPLISLTKYVADMDFGTNYMGKEIGMDPNIYETEIHRGLYRGTIMIERDRIGTGDGFIIPAEQKNKKIKEQAQMIDKSLNNEEKYHRCVAFLDAFQNLWSSGRQSRFLADISPKFIAAALLKTKNPIFLETMSDGIDTTKLDEVVNDYRNFIAEHLYAAQSSFYSPDDKVLSLEKGFAEIKKWLSTYYGIEDKNSV